MGTEVAAFKRIGGVEAAGAYAAALFATEREIAGGGQPFDLLKFDHRSGDWTFGQEGDLVDEQTLLAVNPFSFTKGWIAFDDNGLAETVDEKPARFVVPITGELPYEDELPELYKPEREGRKSGKGRKNRTVEWLLQYGADMAFVDGQDEGVQVNYSPTSMTGHSFMKRLMAEVGRRLADKNPECVAIIELSHIGYTSRTYGAQKKPHFRIVDWKTMDDELFVAPGEEESERPSKHPKKGEKDRRGEPVDKRKPVKTIEGKARRPREESGDEDGYATNGRKDSRRPREEDEIDDQDEDGEPRRTKRTAEPAVRKPRDVFPEDEDDAPRTRKGRREEPVEEDEAPRRKARTAPRDDENADEDEPAPKRRAAREEEEDDAPRRRSARDEEPAPRGNGPRGRAATRGGRRLN